MSHRTGTLNIALDWEVDAIDPPCSFGGWNTGRVVQQIFESLVEDDLEDDASPTTRLVPALAERVTVSDDGRAYRFALRKGVRFHDGAVFDAQAMCLNFARMRDPASPVYSSIAANYNRIGVEWIDTITVVDPFTVDIKLSEPFPDFLRYMTQEDAPGAQVFVSPDALRHFGPDLSDRAPGTGPFLFEERFQTPRGSGVTLRRNEAYWGEPAKLKTLRFPSLPRRVGALGGSTRWYGRPRLWPRRRGSPGPAPSQIRRAFRQRSLHLVLNLQHERPGGSRIVACDRPSPMPSTARR